MESIVDRIEQILKWRKWSRRELAAASHLSENSINTLISRGSTGLRPETLAKIAKGGDVRLEWLVTGDGSPFHLPVGVEPDPTYPTRALALAVAKMDNVPAAVIEKLLALSPSSDPGAWYWIDHLRALMAEREMRSEPAPKR